MGQFLPDGAKKLKERISRYRRALRTDERDGAGKRFLLGTMYLLLDDVPGGLIFYDWYSTSYSDDAPEPGNHLSWTLALYKAGRMGEAVSKLRETMFSNLYLIPHLLGEHQESMAIWHGSNWAELDYAREMPPEILALWDDAAKEWARSVYGDPWTTQQRTRFIEIESRLANLAPGPERSSLVQESFCMRSGGSRLTLVLSSEATSS